MINKFRNRHATRQGLIVAIIVEDSSTEDLAALDPKSGKAKQLIQKASGPEDKQVIGGADDLYREKPSDDLRDSDIVDQEPLQDDIDRVKIVNDQVHQDPDDDGIDYAEEIDPDSLSDEDLDDEA